jgi:hypothetical protein
MVRKRSFFLFNIIFFFISFLGSIFQSFYIYDPFHWGIAQSSIELSLDLKPYRDIFIHYGLLYTITNSIILELTKNNLIYVFFLSSFFYSLGNYLLSNFAFHKLKIKLAYFLPAILFLVHPFANHPWYNYQFYFLIVLSLFFLIKNSKESLAIFGFILALSCLVYENFLFPALIILIIQFFTSKNFKQNLYLMIGFFLPQFLFHFYLFFFELHKYWLKTFWLNEIFLNIYDISFFELILNYFNIFLKKIFFNFITEPFYFLFFLILIINLFYFIKIFLKKVRQKEIEKIEIYIFLISVICLLTFPSTLHKLNIFRFSTGPIIGLILLFYFIEKNFINLKNYIVFLIIIILASSSLMPIKQENNRFFPLFTDVKNNKTSPDIEYFRSQKWSNDIWLVLNQINDKSQKIASNCNEVVNFTNYTKDAFIYMIAKKYINSNQYIFWYQNERYYKILSNHFNVNMNSIIEDINLFKNGIIFFYLEDLYFFKKKIDFKKFEIHEFPYSYKQKRIGLILPNECLRKIL